MSDTSLRARVRAIAALVTSALVAALALVVAPAAIVPAAAFASTALAVAKEGPGSVLADGDATFSLTASNPAGPGAVALLPGPITVSDVLPSGLTVRSMSVAAEHGTCVGAGAVVNCTLHDLGVGASVVITLVVDVSRGASGTIVNTATVSSPHDPTPSQDDASGVVDTSELPATGAAVGGLVGLALSLALLGFALLLVRRREESAA